VTALSIELPPELVEQIARRAAELVPGPSTPWLNTHSAAEYLDCPPSRIHDLRALGKLAPHKDGSRLLFRREDLDDYLLHG
jgi:excisionase family DNA binding protein